MIILRRNFGYNCLAAAAISLVLLAVPHSFAQEDEATAEADEDLEVQVLQAYGWIIGVQGGLSWDFTPEEKEQIMSGIRRAAQGQPAPSNLEELAPKIDETIGAKEREFQELQAAAAKENAKAYLAEAGATEGIEKTRSGLLYQIVDQGIGAFPKVTDVVRIHYQGRFMNGQVFDATVQSGKPADLALDSVIPGFREGLQLIREGGTIVLHIPPDLGYGEQGTRNIPPNSLLIFDINLVEVNPVGARVRE